MLIARLILPSRRMQRASDGIPFGAAPVNPGLCKTPVRRGRTAPPHPPSLAWGLPGKTGSIRQRHQFCQIHALRSVPRRALQGILNQELSSCEYKGFQNKSRGCSLQICCKISKRSDACSGMHNRRLRLSDPAMPSGDDPHRGAANPALAKPLPNAICFPKRTTARRKHHALQAHLGRLPSRHAVDAAGAVRRERPARPEGAHALCRGRAGRAAMGRQERRQFRPGQRRRPGRREACPGAERPGRHDGRARSL